MGHKVYLLPTSYKTKSPDMIIDNETGELKDCSSLTSIDTQLRKAIHQGCRIVFLNVQGDLTRDEINKQIQKRLLNSTNQIEKIIVSLNGIII